MKHKWTSLFFTMESDKLPLELGIQQALRIYAKRLLVLVATSVVAFILLAIYLLAVSFPKLSGILATLSIGLIGAIIGMVIKDIAERDEDDEKGIRILGLGQKRFKKTYSFSIERKLPSQASVEEHHRKLEPEEKVDESVRTLVKQGIAIRSKENYNRALSIFSGAITAKPDYAAAYFNRALTYNAIKNFSAAKTDYETASELTPQDPDIFVNLGNTYYKLKDYNSALSAYNRAIQIDRSHGIAYKNRSVLYITIGNQRAAIADRDTAIGLGISHYQWQDRDMDDFERLGNGA